MGNLKYESKIRGKLRELARYMPEKQECLENAIHPTEKGERGGKLYICNKCGLCFKPNEVQVDHIQPVVPTDHEIESWDEYISRLFCDIENLQVLCKPCHQIKSNNERYDRV
jgi:5-methylcytosine-specific restriction endonuclease McrA